MLLGASLGGEGESDVVAVGLSQNDLGLVDGGGGVLKLGNVEALLLLDVLADNLGDGDLLLDADLLGLWSSDIDRDLEGLSHQGNLEALGLVLLVAVLVLTATIVGLAVAGRLAGGDLHGLGLGLIGDLINVMTINKDDVGAYIWFSI